MCCPNVRVFGVSFSSFPIFSEVTNLSDDSAQDFFRSVTLILCDKMNAPAPPPTSPSSSADRDFSAPPDTFQEFTADVLSSENPEDQQLLQMLEQELSGHSANDSFANDADAEMVDAPTSHRESAEENAKTPATTTTFNEHDEVAQRRNNSEESSDHASQPRQPADNAFDDDSDGLFMPESTPELLIEPPKVKKSRRKCHKDARDYHEYQQTQQRVNHPKQKRGSALKLHKLSVLHQKWQNDGIGKKKKKEKVTKRKSETIFNPSILLGNFESHGARAGDSPSEPVPQHPNATNKDFWKEFKQLNQGMDLHRCSVEWHEIKQASLSFGDKHVSMISENIGGETVNKWNLVGMTTILSPF